MIFVLFLIGYIGLIFYKEDFAYLDEMFFTDLSLRGIAGGFMIWRDSGRFVPWGLQEYNFLALLGKSFLVYRGYSVFQLVILVWAIYQILSKFPIWYRYVTLFFILINPAFVSCFVIHTNANTERNVVFFLALLIWAYIHAINNDNRYRRFYMYSAFIFAQFCLYYKEPVFVMLSGFAITRMIFSFSYDKNIFHRKAIQNFFWRNYIDVGILILSIIFFLNYQIEVAPYITQRFDHVLFPDRSLFDVFMIYIKANFLLIAFFLIFISKVIYQIFRHKSIDSIQESLAVGATLYFLVYVKLKVVSEFRPEYIAPVLLIATLYLSDSLYQFFVIILQRKFLHFKKLILIFLTSLLLFVSLSQYVKTSSRLLLNRRSVVQGNIQLSRAIADHTESSSENSFVLFFPNSKSDGVYIDNTTIFYFSRYLNYKGFQFYPKAKEGSHRMMIDSRTPPSQSLISKKTTLTLKSPNQFPKNQCASWTDVTPCFSANEPQKNELIVLLPGLYPPESIKSLKADSVPLMEYDFVKESSLIEKILIQLANSPSFPQNAYLFRQL
ncbi:hypothetical protein [Cyanothece sp. BG0011]|uniref:hypothetical protein n=2 Tax=Cyanothece sp. BG0011 TaxID=2082950 RepID=UPI000D1DAE26|nr:hypothetical protein [Cyanothece sp. BG0011]